MSQDASDIGRALLVGLTVVVILREFAAASPENTALFVSLAVAMVAAVAILLSKPSF